MPRPPATTRGVRAAAAARSHDARRHEARRYCGAIARVCSAAAAEIARLRPAFVLEAKRYGLGLLINEPAAAEQAASAYAKVEQPACVQAWKAWGAQL